MLKKLGLTVLGLCVVGAGNVMALAQDYSSIATDATAEITAAVPVGLTVFGAVIAIVIGKKAFKAAAR